MKKQLLIAAVAATMTSVAFADISITGSTKANVNNGNPSIEADLNLTGKSGTTSVIANLSLDSAINGLKTVNATYDNNMVEDLYVKTSFEGVNIKAGAYRSGANDLDQTTDPSARYNLSTTLGGITVAYEAQADDHDLTIGGTVAGVSVMHKMKKNDSTETWVSGSMSGVNVAWNQEHTDSTDKNDSVITVSTEFSGVTATYVKIDAETSVAMDGYVGKTTVNAGNDATAIGLSTAVAGNTVTFKAISINDVDSTKVILTRPLASGATFEATYNDSDTDSEDYLDFELAVKF